MKKLMEIPKNKPTAKQAEKIAGAISKQINKKNTNVKDGVDLASIARKVSDRRLVKVQEEDSSEEE